MPELVKVLASPSRYRLATTMASIEDRANWRSPAHSRMEDRKRILVVDDEQEITLVLRSGLTKHRYEVRVAGEGEAALDLFRAWPPDLVISDLSMPNMNGM